MVTTTLIARHPFLTACLGMALLTGMDALVKGLSATYPTFQLVFARFAVTAVLIGTIAASLRHPLPAKSRLSGHMVRALLMVLTTSAFFYALGRLPLAEVFALSFTSPIFTALFAALLLKEPVRLQTALAIIGGFFGVLVIVSGVAAPAATQGDGTMLAFACALLSPITYALSVVLLRAQTASEPLSVIVAVQALLVSLILAPLAGAGFVWPSGQDLPLFIALGGLGAAGYMAFAAGLKHLAAARFSLVEYTGLIWAAVLGFFVFAEVPGPRLWIGAALIIGSCLAVLRQRG